jgi:quinol monooxygenase YgiN
MPVITVVATVRAKPGCEEKMKNALLELVEPTHRENGCINYDLHQSIEEKGVFVFHENWQSKADLDRHMKAPHFLACVAKCKDWFAAEPEIRLFAKIG